MGSWESLWADVEEQGKKLIIDVALEPERLKQKWSLNWGAGPEVWTGV